MKKPSYRLTGAMEGMREADTATISAFLSENQCAASACKHSLTAAVSFLAREGHLEPACLALARGVLHE